jgi:hypothetical protein
VYDASFSLNIFDPTDTISPRIAKLSFTAIGIPSKNDFDAFPFFLFASDARAVSNAFSINFLDRSSRPFTNAFAKCLSRSTLRFEKSTKSSLVNVPLANASCASTTLRIVGAFEAEEEEVNRELQMRFSSSSPSRASRLLVGKIESLVVVEARTRKPRREEEEEENKSGRRASARLLPRDDVVVFIIRKTLSVWKISEGNTHLFLDKFLH